MKPRPLIVGNWKMNGLSSALQEAYALNDYLRTFHTDKLPDVILCPPVTLLMTLAHKLIEKPFALGAQDCHIAASGPHTGDISAEMLADAGASAIIAGHSERRYSYAETDSQVQAKQSAIHRAGLVAIICVGETLGQRLADITLSVVERQLEGSLGPNSTSHNTVVAYEPVWAIGSGMTPTLSEVSEVHSMIRSVLTKRFNEHGSQMRILYGGSVNPKNAGDLLSVKNVDGALVGGASLKSENFIGIISANNGK